MRRRTKVISALLGIVLTGSVIFLRSQWTLNWAYWRNYREILAKFEERGPVVLSVSPDLSHYAVSDSGEHDFCLKILKVDSSEMVFSERSIHPFERVTWHPSGKRLLFQQARDWVDYEIFEVDLAEKKNSKLNLPPTPILGGLYWSDRGDRLAYFRLRSGGGEFTVVDRTENALKEIASFSADSHEDFAWSSEGERIAIVGKGALRVVYVNENRALAVSLRDADAVRRPAWCGENCLLLPMRKRGAEFFSLFRVWLDGRSKEIISARGDVFNPVMLPGVGNFIYHVESAERTQAFVAKNWRVSDQILSRSDSFVVEFLSAGRGVGKSRPLYEPPRFHEIQLAESITLRPLFEKYGGRMLSSVPGRRLDIPTSSGKKIPAFLWLSNHPPRGAVLKVHGGPDAHATPDWSFFNQLLNEKGIHVVEINYRGSTGYGRTWNKEGVSLEGQVSDVMSGLEFLHAQLGIPQSQIVLYGLSYGTRLALLAALKSQVKIGALFLVAPAFRFEEAKGMTAKMPVYAFHGELDLFDPADSRRALKAISPSLDFQELAMEFHVFARRSSWASLYARLFQAFDQ